MKKIQKKYAETLMKQQISDIKVEEIVNKVRG